MMVGDGRRWDLRLVFHASVFSSFKPWCRFSGRYWQNWAGNLWHIISTDFSCEHCIGNEVKHRPTDSTPETKLFLFCFMSNLISGL